MKTACALLTKLQDPGSIDDKSRNGRPKKTHPLNNELRWKETRVVNIFQHSRLNAAGLRGLFGCKRACV